MEKNEKCLQITQMLNECPDEVVDSVYNLVKRIIPADKRRIIEKTRSGQYHMIIPLGMLMSNGGYFMQIVEFLNKESNGVVTIACGYKDPTGQPVEGNITQAKKMLETGFTQWLAYQRTDINSAKANSILKRIDYTRSPYDESMQMNNLFRP